MIKIQYYDRWDDTEKTLNCYSYEERAGNIKNLKQVNLILGRACNMNCPHCSQNVAKDYLAGKSINDDTMKWLIDWCNINKQNRYRRNILFWGGEPLLYINVIKDIVEKFKDANVPNVHYIVFTNGKALTDEIADYFYNNRFELVLSCDAPNPTLVRSEPPTENAIEIFNNYRGTKRVNSIYTAQTPSLVEAFQYLEDKFPNAKYSMGYIRDGIGVESSLVDFPDGKIEKDFAELYTYSMEHKDIISLKNFLFGKYKRMLKAKAIPLSDWQKYPIPYCNASLESLSIDLDGNIYNCHNGNNIIGNITKGYIDAQNTMLEQWKELMPENCYTCEYAAACGNSCTEYVRSEDGKCLKQCATFKRLLNSAYNICKYGLDENGEIINGK